MERQDAMRTRVRLFAEGVVKMVSPVLLALALKKVDFKGEGPWFMFVRGCISPIAAVTMAFSILQMVFLWLCLSKLVGRLEWLQAAASKLLVHLCAVLLMCLAYDILLLISMDYRYWGIMVLASVVFVMLCYICSLLGDGAIVAHANAGYDRDLELSVDFSAAFTALLFLGLERLALEVHETSNGKGMPPHGHLESCLALSFTACLIGVVIMLVWTIPPSVGSEEESTDMRGCIEACNVALAMLIAGIVLWITWAPLKANALWVIVPPLISLLCWMYLHFDYIGDGQRNDGRGLIENQQQQQPEEEVKPPSLELTKFALAGFLTVSIPSISDSSRGIWTHAFILLTAISVVSALVWRLLGHRANPKPAEVTAANITSTSAHGFAILALVPFAVMAHMNARLITTPH
ncbi:unnamed protein product [Urochloa humidicola]